MRTSVFGLLGLLTLAGACPAAPNEVAPLRIGLVKSLARATTLLVSCDKPFAVKDSNSGQILAKGAGGNVFRVAVSPVGLTLTPQDLNPKTAPLVRDQPILIAPQTDGAIKISRLDATAGTTPRWRRYRGVLSMRRRPDGTLQTVNTVALEPYLYGVIPAEIGTNVPAEAMKAQAVAARTYALKNRGKLAREGFDLDDTTRCEGYLGVDGETPQSNAAVDATRGQILTYQGKLIDAPYSSDSGGVTACDTSGECPYLQAVRDAPSPDGPDYAGASKNHTWTKTFTPAELALLLARDPRTRVNKFASLALDGLDASGRITTATVWSTDGTMKTVAGPQLRQILGYDTLRSTRVTLTVTAGGNYQFDGRGWGHGLGMSQDGAVSMAAPPYKKSYTEILRHYYVGIALASAGSLPAANLATARRAP